MIYVTHDQVEAMTLADRMAVMQAGVIQQFDTPDAIYRQPANLFVASFLGSPGMNLFRGRLARQDGRIVFGDGHLALDVSAYPFRQAPADGQACVLGVRPEDVEVRADGPYRGNVTLVEAMGAHRVLWLDHHGTQVAAIVQDEHPAVAGAAPFALRPGHVSLFDEASTQRL
jgi:multiple sugar transport system ATP-binding protein